MDRIIWRAGTKELSLDTNRLVGYDGCEIVPLFGRSGFLLPPVSLITDKVPRRPGNVLRERVVDSRKVDIPLRISAPNFTQLLSVQRLIAETLYASTGNLVFNYGGVRRELVGCSYVGGFTGNDNDSDEFVVWSKMMLSFEAHDPYFYGFGTDDYISLSAKIQQTEATTFFDNDFLGSMLGENMVGDLYKGISNPGADTAWMVWKITGPVSSGFTVRIIDGPSFTINKSISAGEEVTVDTTKGIKTVTSSVSGDIFSYLDNSSILWGIPPGSWDIKADFSGFSSETKIEGEARIPYSTY